MGDNGEVARVGDEYDNVESSCESIFSVGEVVEYWEGGLCWNATSWIGRA